jgi:hypothetical protein
MKKWSIYMRHIKTSLIICLAFLLLIGCTAQALTNNSTVKEGTDAQVKYEVIKPPYPSELHSVIEAKKKSAGTHIVEKDKYTYILITLGQRPSAGYSIEIKDVQKVNGTIVIRYTEKKPEGMAAMMLTYPSLVLKMNDTPESVSVEEVK